MADFTPPPSTPLADFDDELELVRTTSEAQIRNDVEILIASGNPRESLRPYLEDPTAAVASLSDVLAEFWRRALEPDWPRVRALLEADLLYRSRRLTEGGVTLLFSDLHPDVEWVDGGVEVAMRCSDHVELSGRGLLLVPSAFSASARRG